LSPWAPGGRGPRCFAPVAPMVATPLAKGDRTKKCGRFGHLSRTW